MNCEMNQLNQPSANLNSWAKILTEKALEHHRRSEYDRAEVLYREILSKVGNYPDALHLLGLLYKEFGKFPQALKLMNAAIAVDRQAIFFLNRSVVLLEMQEYALAQQDAMAAIRMGHANADSYVNLLSALRGLKNRNKFLRFGAQAVAKFPENPSILNNYGAGLLDYDQWNQALSAFSKAVEIDPFGLPWRENLSKMLWKETDSAAAEAHSKAAIQNGSYDVDLMKAYGEYLRQSGRDTEANDVFVRLMLKGKQVSIAEKTQDADFINLLFGVATQLQESHRFDDALGILNRLTDLRSDSMDVINNLGVAYFTHGDYAGALRSFEKALIIDENNVMLLRNIGVCHFMLVHLEEALVFFKRAYALDKNDCVSLLYLFGQKLSCVDWEDLENLGERLLRFSLEKAPSDMSASLAYLMLVEKHQDMKNISELVGKSIFKSQKIYPGLSPLKVRKSEKIRVGYFSYDFRTHPVSYLTQEIYSLHDRSRFEVYALSYGPDDQSEFRRSIERDVDVFVDLERKSSEDLCETIRQLELDILVDLTGNTQGTRSRVLANRLAPVQCHWLGYVSSMGSGVYDYIIGDPFTTPPEFDSSYGENVARLPITMQISSRLMRPSSKVFSRADFGIPEDAFLFANFGSFSKIHPKVFDAWMRILNASPSSVLWLARTHRTPVVAFERLAERAQAHGVSRERLIFSEPLNREDHLHRYDVADLCLDTYPQGSGTTAIEGLSMGCPMISMAAAGETYAIRMPGSILKAVGLDDLIVDSYQSYESLAVQLCRDKPRVGRIRNHLTTNKLQLPLFDTPRATAYLESAFEHMARRCREGLPAASFDVDSDIDTSSGVLSDADEAHL